MCRPTRRLGRLFLERASAGDVDGIAALYELGGCSPLRPVGWPPASQRSARCTRICWSPSRTSAAPTERRRAREAVCDQPPAKRIPGRGRNSVLRVAGQPIGGSAAPVLRTIGATLATNWTSKGSSPPSGDQPVLSVLIHRWSEADLAAGSAAKSPADARGYRHTVLYRAISKAKNFSRPPGRLCELVNASQRRVQPCPLRPITQLGRVITVTYGQRSIAGDLRASSGLTAFL
jgi:hypothetical protein